MDGHGHGQLYGMTPDIMRQQQRQLMMMNSITDLVPPPMLMLTHQYHHEELEAMAAVAGAPSSSTTTTTTTTTQGYFELDHLQPNNGRWPRQETLNLLEIRSNLHSKFKQANHKGPLWDEVSRIMAEEHGYQRTGKKCREKFENLYKYYKKTKHGKASRQDGKHYRFFKQLEALYGTTPTTDHDHDHDHHQYQQPTNPNTNSDQLLDISSNSNDDDHEVVIQMKEFMDSQMRKLMEKQEEWLAKMIKIIDRRDEERVLKEEEWRKQDVVRVESECLFWANEKAWIEARDASLMEVLKKLSSGKEHLNLEMINNIDHVPNHHHDYDHQFDASCVVSNGIQDSYLGFFMMGDQGQSLWESSYNGLNLNKQENH